MVAVVKNSCGQTITQYNVQTGDSVNNLNQVAPAASGTVLTSNGVASQPSFQSISSPSPSSTVSIKDDFIVLTAISANTYNSELCWNVTGTISGTPALDAGHPGIVGNASLGAGAVYALTSTTNSTQMIFGGGILSCNWVFKINTLSDVTNTYGFAIGMTDFSGTADMTNGVYFRYSSATNSGNWQIVTAAASVRTTTNSAVAATTGWHNAGFIMNAAGNSVEFFMDGVSLGTITTNIPTAQIAPSFTLARTAGTIAAQSLNFDLMYLTQTLTVAR